MRVSATVDVSRLERDLSAFGRDVIGTATPRAANKLIEQAQTVGMRQVAAEYGIPVTKFRAYLRLRLARPGTSEASVSAAGKGLPLYLFSPRATQQGVSVRVKGKRVLVPHAFVARMASGRIGVFARGAYGGKGQVGRQLGTFGRFVFHSGRKVRGADGSLRTLPINELYTFGPAEAWSSDRVVGAMQARVEEQAGTVLQQEIRFASR